MSIGAATAGRVATSKGQQGLSPPLLDLGWFLLLLLALGFSDGYEACPAPPPLGASLLSSNRTGLGTVLKLPTWPWRSSNHGGFHSRPRCLQGLTAGCPALHRPRLLLQTTAARTCFLFFFSLSFPSPSQPQNNFPLYKQNSLVRKQYHFRSKDERDINLVVGKFSFTV